MCVWQKRRRSWEGGREGGGQSSTPPSLLCHLMWRFQHLHEEGVDGRVADELEKEQVLQTLEADGAKCR